MAPKSQTREDAALDEALAETFPASDPVALHDPLLEEKRAARLKKKRKKKKKTTSVTRKARKAPARRKKTKARR